MYDTNKIVNKILGSPIRKDGKSKNKGSGVTVTWRQESYPDPDDKFPNYVVLTKEFNSREEANKWINSMNKSAMDINKTFDVLSIK